MIPLRLYGWTKVIGGLTTVEEVVRVTASDLEMVGRVIRYGCVFLQCRESGRRSRLRPSGGAEPSRGFPQSWTGSACSRFLWCNRMALRRTVRALQAAMSRWRREIYGYPAARSSCSQKR